MSALYYDPNTLPKNDGSHPTLNKQSKPEWGRELDLTMLNRNIVRTFPQYKTEKKMIEGKLVTILIHDWELVPLFSEELKDVQKSAIRLKSLSPLSYEADLNKNITHNKGWLPVEEYVTLVRKTLDEEN